MSYGYGLGSEGVGYKTLPLSHFESALDSMSEMIQNVGADIVLLQEVDFYAKRSHYQDQLAELSRKTGLIYHQELVSWDAPYVPYPSLNPKNQFGRVKSGGGILSRFPIKSIQSDLLPKPKENGKLYNFFYLNRYLQMVEIEGYRICNLHLEAFSMDNRELHLVKLQNRLVDFNLDIAAGDFNGTATLLDSVKDQWTAYFAPEPTFPSPNPDQTLDGFILKNQRFKKIEVKTLNSGTVSDHFPVLLEVES